jgi:hypothetical protein
MYLQGTSIPGAGWGLLGLAVRLAIERGLHRRRSFSKDPQATEELLKRSFWLSTQKIVLICDPFWLTIYARCLVFIDRMAGSFVGRGCLLMEEE